MTKTGVTLLEIIIVIIIIGILATVSFTQYSAIRERSFDKEATVNLKLIQAAERIFRMENRTLSYYPSAGSQNSIALINQNLKLTLPAAANRNWNYIVFSTGCCNATRTRSLIRSWFLTINDADGEPDFGVGCP